MKKLQLSRTAKIVIAIIVVLGLSVIVAIGYKDKTDNPLSRLYSSGEKLYMSAALSSNQCPTSENELLICTLKEYQRDRKLQKDTKVSNTITHYETQAGKSIKCPQRRQLEKCLLEARFRSLDTTYYPSLGELVEPREEGRDAASKAALQMARATAELHYDNQSSSYAGFCTSSMSPTSPQTTYGAKLICNDSTETWAAAIDLLNQKGSYFCVDSTGISKVITGKVGGTGKNDFKKNSLTCPR